MLSREQKAIKIIEEINKNMEYKYDKKIGQYVCIALRHCDRKVFKTLLNLIEKQQKELEIFERIKNGETIMFSSKAQYWRRDKVEKYFISKYKIRKKIEEYQKHIDNINNKAPKRKDGKPNNIYNHANREFYKSKVEVLEKLLEEN